jgi:hypothetical protein
MELLGELLWHVLDHQIVREVALEHVFIASHADLGAKDEGGACHEDHVVEIAAVSNMNSPKVPYLARQLSVFDDRQLVTGLLGTIV